MPTSIPSVPHFAPVLHHASTTPQGAAIDPDFFGSNASLKPTLSSTARVPSSTLSSSPTTLLQAASIKTPVPAKSEYITYSMAVDTPTSVPTNISHGSKGILGWGLAAEISFFVAVAVLGLCLPIGLCLYLRRRHQAKHSVEEPSSPSASSTNTDLTFRGSTTRPPTASSWLEMSKHRTETPAPPHASDENKNDLFYEPPKLVRPARRKFCARLSGRTSEEDIEQQVRELDEEVRRRSKLSRSRGYSVGVLPDLEDPCSECAMSYTHDERGHTQPVEGRKGTPIPFLASVELDLAIVAAVMKEEKEAADEEVEEEESIEKDIADIEVVEEKVKQEE